MRAGYLLCVCVECVCVCMCVCVCFSLKEMACFDMNFIHEMWTSTQTDGTNRKIDRCMEQHIYMVWINEKNSVKQPNVICIPIPQPLSPQIGQFMLSITISQPDVRLYARLCVHAH